MVLGGYYSKITKGPSGNTISKYSDPCIAHTSTSLDSGFKITSTVAKSDDCRLALGGGGGGKGSIGA